MKEHIVNQAAAVCRLLRNYRVSRGITQMSCASAAGISQQYLVRIENGRQNVSFRIVLSLCKVLGVKPSDVLKEVAL